MSSRGRIVVAGRAFDVAGQAGATWAVLQYVLGLRELGYDVWLLEPVAQPTAATVRAFEAVSAEFELGSRAALLVGHGGETIGAPSRSVRAACDSADALLDLSGVLAEHDLLDRFAVRAYVDLDPAFNQLWHASGIDRGFDSHTHHFTVGLNIGRDGCDSPTCGIDWIPTLPPVALSAWPLAPPRPNGTLTSLANWRSYGSIEWRGVRYGQKAHSLRRLAALPSASTERFVLALEIDPAEDVERQALSAGGWELVDPRRVAGSPAAYRRFISGSKAEIGVAKAGYVTARCGWLSDRSACYLASGRPVLAQDTGIADVLPLGNGLLTFTDSGGALAALDALDSTYARHAVAAREIAEAYLDARLVLGRMLEELGGPTLEEWGGRTREESGVHTRERRYGEGLGAPMREELVG